MGITLKGQYMIQWSQIPESTTIWGGQPDRPMDKVPCMVFKLKYVYYIYIYTVEQHRYRQLLRTAPLSRPRHKLLIDAKTGTSPVHDHHDGAPVIRAATKLEIFPQDFVANN